MSERQMIEAAIKRLGLAVAQHDKPRPNEIEVYTEGAYGNCVVFVFDGAGRLTQLLGFGD